MCTEQGQQLSRNDILQLASISFRLTQQHLEVNQCVARKINHQLEEALGGIPEFVQGHPLPLVPFLLPGTQQRELMPPVNRLRETILFDTLPAPSDLVHTAKLTECRRVVGTIDSCHGMKRCVVWIGEPCHGFSHRNDGRKGKTSSIQRCGWRTCAVQ